MIEALIAGTLSLFQPMTFLLLIAGSIVGIILGVVPGVSGGTAVVLILPFLYGMDPLVLLPVLSAMYGVSYTGGSITAVLAGIPGDAGNAATVLDGYPMTRKGEGGRGIGAAVTASSMGGIVSIVFALIMMPLVIPIVLLFRSPELFLMIVLGLSFLAVLTKGSPIKGLMSAGLGLLLSTIGAQAITGSSRFTFGNDYLYDGINLVAILMGLFGVAVIVELAVKKESLSKIEVGKSAYHGLFQGVLDVFRHWWLWLCSSAIGYFVGLIPGIGGSTAIWVSYALAKQTSKTPDKFGTGCVEGVIAPESANNAKDGGALLTTLAFGIPGSGVMVIFLAAFLLMGLTPGPKLLQEHADLCFSMLVALVIANIIAGVFCFSSIPFLVKLTRVPDVYIFSLVLPLIFIGVYSYRLVILDLPILIIIGIVGMLLKKFGYSLAALILGFVLGPLFEYYLWHSIDLHGLKSFMSPISIVLIITILFVLLQPMIGPTIKRLFSRKARIAS